MCGRYTLYAKEEIEERYNVKKAPSFEPSYNISPSQNAPAIVSKTSNSVMLMKWGLIPSWAKEPGIGFKMINARSETAPTSPAFRGIYSIY
jgi:putative SOS response-associated peptidase YedK